MRGERLAGLDGLRGIAALSVLVYHVIPFASGEWRGDAYLAVDFFFMLSGYVMARTYEGRMAEGLSPAAFFALRFRRLWPTMFAAGLLGLPWFFVTYGFDRSLAALANLLLIPTLAMRWAYPLNGPAWSIFFELFANVLHASLLRRLSAARLALVAALMVPILAGPAMRLTFDLGSPSATFMFGFPRVILSYSIGIILWRRWRDQPSLEVPPAFAFLAMPLFFGESTWLDANGWLGALLFILVICPIMIAGGLRWRGEWRLASLAGAISFPLYALHTPIFAAVTMAGLPIYWGVGLSLVGAYLFTRVASRLGGRASRRARLATA